MAYRQEPGRGPMATFKNVTSLLGPTANGVDPKTGVKTVEVDRKARQTGGNVNYMIRDGYQPKGEYVNPNKGVSIVKYVNKKGDTQYHQFNNNPDSDNKLHRVIDKDKYKKMAFTHSEGFVKRDDLKEVKASKHSAIGKQVLTNEMADNFEAKNP